VQRAINVQKLLRFALSSSQITVDAETERVKRYIQYYHEALPVGASLPSTELQPADDFALLAGNAFISLWDLTRDYRYLYSAASFLEFALSRSKQSFLSRLILIRIYRLIGTSDRAFNRLIV
jgi:N-terminal acetyltransferase B complex non-catalytic subunit